MPMSDGTNTLKKIAFQIGNKFFRFALNPESISHSKPHRTTAIKTKSRIVIEDFQSDIPTITISGTTGFNPTGKASDRGIAKIKELKTYVEEYAKMGGNGRTTAEDFYFHDFTNDESYVVHLSPEGVTYTQDVSSPLLHRYEIKFVVLRKSSEPADEDIVNPEIGNRYPSITSPIASPVPFPTNPNVGWGNNGVTNGSVNLPTPLVPNTGMTMPSPVLPGTAITMPNPILPGYGNTQTSGGNNTSGNSNVYNEGTSSPYAAPSDSEPINPQAPSSTSYYHGMTGLGYSIGYYGRSLTS